MSNIWPDLAFRSLKLEESASGREQVEPSDESLLGLALSEYLTGAVELARDHYELVLENCGERPMLAQAQLGLAWIAYTNSDWEACREGLDWAGELSADELINCELFALEGLLHYRQGEYHESEAACRRSLKVEKECFGLGLAHSTLGILLHAQQFDGKALQHWEMAEGVAQELGRPDLQVRVLTNRGTYYFNHEDLPRAKLHFMAAIDLGEQVHYQVYLGFPYLNLAGVHMRTREYPASLACLKRSADLFHQLGDKMMLGAVHSEFGSIYRRQGALDQALHHLEHAQELTLSCGAMRDLIFVQRELGLLHAESGQPQAAREELRLAMDLAGLLEDHVILDELMEQRSQIRGKP